MDRMEPEAFERLRKESPRLYAILALHWMRSSFGSIRVLRRQSHDIASAGLRPRNSARRFRSLSIVLTSRDLCTWGMQRSRAVRSRPQIGCGSTPRYRSRFTIPMAL
jgi:hypothetical protein